MTPMKTCTGPCGGAYPETIDHFPIDRGRLRTRCKECYREYRRPSSRASDAKRRAKGGIVTVDSEVVPLLEIGPISGYLNRQREKFETAEGLAKFLGLTPKTVGKILEREQKTSSLDTVDRILCAFKDPHMLRELYPELYDYDEIEAEAWIEEWVEQNVQSHS
jgi:DNA-binding XRE family transcriptional regulator